jgi:hypothetical protein
MWNSPPGIFGLWLLSTKPKLIKETQGKVVEVTATPFPMMRYEFSVPGQSDPIQSTNIGTKDQFNKYTKDQSINVFYDPSNPTNNALQSDDARKTGFYIVIVVLVLLALSWWFYSLASR